MSNSEEAFEQQKAEINDTYARSGFARLVDYVRDNPQFRSGADGETLHLTANRAFSHLEGDAGPIPVMNIDLTVSFKNAGVEQKAALTIGITGKASLSISSSGFAGTSGDDFKRVSAVKTRFNKWLQAVEKKTGITDLTSRIQEKAGYSGSNQPRAPEKARYEGQSPA